MSKRRILENYLYKVDQDRRDMEQRITEDRKESEKRIMDAIKNQNKIDEKYEKLKWWMLATWVGTVLTIVAMLHQLT